MDLFLAYTIGMPKRMGRPPKPKDQRQTAAVRLRMREADHEVLQEAAEHAGLSLSAWARSVLMKAARRELKT